MSRSYRLGRRKPTNIRSENGEGLPECSGAYMTTLLYDVYLTRRFRGVRHASAFLPCVRLSWREIRVWQEEEAGFTRWLVVSPLQYLAGAIGLGRLRLSENATASEYVHRCGARPVIG